MSSLTVMSMDAKSAKLAIEMQLADLTELLDSPEESDDLHKLDERVGLTMMKSDLERQLQILQGQLLTLKMLKDEHDNGVAFKKLLAEEKRAVNDHRLAMSLAGLESDHPDVKKSTEYEASLCSEYKPKGQNGELATASGLGQEQIGEKRSHSAAFSFNTASRAGKHFDACAQGSDPQDLTENQRKCSACMEIVPTANTLALDCKPDAHIYCLGCVMDLFKSSLHDTSLFPPRCCKVPIPVETCRAILPKELIKEFDLKVEELATPNPTYCSNAECAKFVQLKDIKNDVGTCVFCKEKTCALCKSKDHGGLCPTDPHVQLLMDVAKRAKWQQCGRCKNMVELERGCFHMTCRCSHQFCYLCGVQWKRCKCPHMDEDYLTRTEPAAPAAQAPAAQIQEQIEGFNAASRAIERNIAAVRSAIAPPIQAAAVPTAGNDPNPRPCRNHQWARYYGGDCEDCGANYLLYVMRCRKCFFESCWRCIHNRD